MGARGARPDHFTRRAQAAGHPARSIYKLEEMDRRWRLLRQGARVLDLGAAPGSWLVYAASRVGGRGHVVGVDLQPLAPNLKLPPWAQAVQADAFTWQPEGRADFDLVLSDMAPKTSGDAMGDGARSAALAERALELALVRGAPGGHVAIKLLESEAAQMLAQRLRVHYDRLERLRPQATRRHSREIFLLGLGKKAARATPT